MIANLKGIVLCKETGHVVIDVNGVGYLVFVSLNTFYELPPEGLETSLQIHTHLREDQLSLYGFSSAGEKNIFSQLLKVNGIGPKLAMTLLSGLSAAQISEAIARGDAALLQSVPGIGKKVSERILLDLKGKVTPLKSDARPVASQAYDEALSALTHLGYTPSQADKALEKLDWSRGLTLPEAIRQGLKNLSRG